MDENRKKLIQIMLDHHLAADEKEAGETVIHLSDDEVNELIGVYTDLDDLDSAITDDLKTLAPEEYEKIYKEYEGELENLQKEKREKVEKQWEIEDDELDALESANEEKLDEKLAELDKEIDEVESDQEELHKKLNEDISSASENN